MSWHLPAGTEDPCPRCGRNLLVYRGWILACAFCPWEMHVDDLALALNREINSRATRLRANRLAAGSNLDDRIGEVKP